MTDEIEALAARIGMYYHDGNVNLCAPLYAFTPTELQEFARRLSAKQGNAVPEGWKLAPVIPTAEMDAAGKQALSDNGVDTVEDCDALICFHAMLAAAPEPPK